MGKLNENHRSKLAANAVAAGFEIDSRLLGSLVDNVTRDELEHLPKNIDVVAYVLILTLHSKSSSFPPSVSALDFKLLWDACEITSSN